MGRPRIRRRRDGVYQIVRPRKWRPAAVAVALALGALPITMAVALVLPVLILEIPPMLVAGGIALLLIFLERRRASRALARNRPHLRVIEPLRGSGSPTPAPRH